MTLTSNGRRATTAVAGIAATVALLVLAVSVVAAIPSDPASYHGAAEASDGTNAPTGTVIVAVVDGEKAGSITVTDPGQYGGSGATDDKLRVNSSAGETITFHVNSTGGPVADPPGEHSLESGTHELDLVFPAGTFGDAGDDTGNGGSTGEMNANNGGSTGGSDSESDVSTTQAPSGDGSDATGAQTSIDDAGDSGTDQTAATSEPATSEPTTSAATSTQTTTRPVPGFGPVVVLIALLAVALLARRRG